MFENKGMSLKKKLLYIVNADWFFSSHRFELALNAIKAGFDVHVILNCTSIALVEKFTRSGLTIHRIKSPRGKHGPISTIEHLYKYFTVINSIQPDVVHLITMKPIILGGIIARMFHVHCIASITGLGPAFECNGRSFIKKTIFKALLKLALKAIDDVIVQNQGDKDFIGKLTKNKLETALIKGSGVPLDQFKPAAKLPCDPFIVVSSARFLIQKGFIELVQASERLQKRGIKFKLKLYGWRDEGNKANLTEKTLNNWLESGIVDSIERVDDMAPALRNSSLFVLASYYGEGLPRAVIEAQASGLPVITSSIPGCVDSIIDGVTGQIVPPKDVFSLERAMEEFILNPEKSRAFGTAAREFAIKTYSIESVVQEHLRIYSKRLLTG